jgi:methylmalonyl-CoA mutase
MSKNAKLFEHFPPITTKEWMDKINTDLKGADFNNKLVWKTREGFEVHPFYREEDLSDLKYLDSLPGEFPFLRGSKTGNNTWKVRQNITVTDYPEANRKALDILMKGVDSVGFAISDPESVSFRNLEILLNDISPEAVELNFLSNGRAKEIVKFFLQWINKIGADPEKISGAIETDPLGRLAVNGTLCIPVDKGLDYLAEVAGALSSLPVFRAIHLNASG